MAKKKTLDDKIDEAIVRRNRVKIAKYDPDVMREAATRQPTMEQYMRLSEIEDLEKANYVARFLGTKNFDREVETALKQQRDQKERKKIRERLSSFASELEDASYDAIKALNLVSVESIYLPFDQDKEKKLEALSKDGNVYFYGEGYGFTVYRQRDNQDDEKVAEAKEKRRKIDELEERAKDLYRGIRDRAEAFIMSYRRGDQAPIITRALIESVVCGDIKHGNIYYGIAKSLGWEAPEDLQTWEDTYRLDAVDYIFREMDKNISRVMLHALWICVPHGEICHLPYHATKLEPYKNHNWGVILGLLERLGYNVAQDEWDFITGHHPIYSEEIER